ncbi:MAG: DNA methyltransferase [Snowella sp.]|jgi:predicted helicase|nr:MAG: DNA methyltransferase [Snowella sp.]
MDSLQIYLQTIQKIYQTQKATEHSYRPALQEFIQSFGDKLTVTNEPKRIACGAPDFVISQKLQELGYIEAKDIGVELKKEEKSNQMKRYLGALGNLIFTNYLDFRWYVGGEFRSSASLGTFDKKGIFKADTEGQAQVEILIKGFLEAEAPQAKSPKELAKKMADLAQLIRDAIAIKLKDAKEGILFDQYQSFQQVLIRDLTRADFADMYAQTICYGLFAARCNTKAPQNFSRQTAAYALPKTNPFLRDIFDKIAGIDLDESIAWAVDILANILKLTDMEAILRDFGKRTRREDPVVHFYETFLAEYDPKMRQSRGVYYTPEPVVSYIVRSVDYILKEKFGIKDGLASKQKVLVSDPQDPKKTIESHQVLILDPAVGTGTFLHGVIDHIYESFKNKKGMWSSYVGNHLLPRLFGFELLMAPYTVAHMKLGLQLQELGYEFDSDERLKIYLTNTLQDAIQLEDQLIGFASRIKAESEQAKEIKQEDPVMVILGNPPYSGHSSNKGDWITNLLHGKDTLFNISKESYFEVDGAKLNEKNSKWLNDDYVKFIRFAQWRIEKTGYGVVAFITNHGYLDNPTFRGMRQSLMNTFDEIYVLDLHGNSKKKEVSPDGTTDQNVFDIQQGVSIIFLIKNKDKKTSSEKLIYHQDLYGLREIKENGSLTGGKYYWLNENDFTSTNWQALQPDSPFYLFQHQNINLRIEYNKFFNVSEIMPVNSVGIVTARDSLTIHWSQQEIWDTVNNFVSLDSEEAREKYDLGKDSNDWTINSAQKDIKQSKLSKINLVPILYRPFDTRYTYYTGVSGGFHCRARGEVMNHLVGKENLGLVTTRQITSRNFCHINVSKSLIELKVCSHDRNSQVLPLYLYPSDKPTLFEPPPTSAPGGRRPNLDKKFIQEFAQKLNLEFIADGKGDQTQTFGPEDIFNYIYAVFHSPTYRTRYAEFLKIDFPRVPLTSQTQLFWQLAKLGDELVQIHLMKTQLNEIVGFPIEGDNIIEKITYTEPTEKQNGRVYINKTQYIDNVPPEIYNFYIGGYQVCHKWLKDRKDRELTDDDFEHYSQIVAILQRTIELMKNIDQTIENYGGFPLQ